MFLVFLFLCCAFINVAKNCEIDSCADGNLSPAGILGNLLNESSEYKMQCKYDIRTFFAQQRNPDENPWITFKLKNQDYFEVFITNLGYHTLSLLYHIPFHCVITYSHYNESEDIKNKDQHSCYVEQHLASNNYFSRHLNFTSVPLSRTAATDFPMHILQTSDVIMVQCSNVAISETASDYIWELILNSGKLQTHLGLYSPPLPTAPQLFLKRLSYFGEHKLEVGLYWTCPQWNSLPVSYQVSCVSISGGKFDKNITDPSYQVCKQDCSLCLENCWIYNQCDFCTHHCDKCWDMWHSSTIGFQSGGPLVYNQIIDWQKFDGVLTIQSAFRPFEALFKKVEPTASRLYKSTVLCKIRANSVQGSGQWSNLIPKIVDWRVESYAEPKLVLQQEIPTISIADIVVDMANGHTWNLVSFDNTSKIFFNYSKIYEVTHMAAGKTTESTKQFLTAQLESAAELGLFTLQDPTQYMEIECLENKELQCELLNSVSFSMKPLVSRSLAGLNFVMAQGFTGNACFDFISSKWYVVTNQDYTTKNEFFITEIERTVKDNTIHQSSNVIWKGSCENIFHIQCMPLQSSIFWTANVSGNFTLNGIAWRHESIVSLFKDEDCHKCTRNITLPVFSIPSPLNDLMAVVTERGVELLSIHECDCMLIVNASYLSGIGIIDIMQFSISPNNLAFLTTDGNVTLITLPFNIDLLDWFDKPTLNPFFGQPYHRNIETIYIPRALFPEDLNQFNDYPSHTVKKGDISNISNVWLSHTGWNLFSPQDILCLYPMVKDVKLDMTSESTASIKIHAEWDDSNSCSNISKPSIFYEISYLLVKDESTKQKLKQINTLIFDSEDLWDWKYDFAGISFCSYRKSGLTSPDIFQVSMDCIVKESFATTRLDEIMHISLKANKTYYIEVQAVPILSEEFKTSTWFDISQHSRPPYLNFVGRQPYTDMINSTFMPSHAPEGNKNRSLILFAILGVLLLIIVLLLIALWYYYRMQIQLGWNLKRIQKSDIQKILHLGSGNFCEVWKCKLTDKKEKGGFEIVAVKMLKSNGTEKQKKQFLEEAFILSKLQNCKYIVKTLGICMQSMHPTQLVLEYFNGGAVNQYLRRQSVRDTLTNPDILRMCIQVCKACCYLESKGYIHRDIAARNCLVITTGNEIPKFVKLADFGLAKDERNYYETVTPELAVPWTAPESFEGRFSSKSDVWSFGVLIWEVFAWGALPYGKCGYNIEFVHFCRMPLMSNYQIKRHVCFDKKTLLDLNNPCTTNPLFPGCLINIFRKCWNYSPERRCSFLQLYKMLKGCDEQLDRKQGFPKIAHVNNGGHSEMEHNTVVDYADDLVLSSQITTDTNI